MASDLNLSKLTELKQRLWFLLGALIVYRVGVFIPVPGIDPVVIANTVHQSDSSMLAVFNMFSGGALSRFAVLALGPSPYITASIIVQMMTMVIPSLSQLRKDGNSGRRQITQYTRYFTVILALIQGFALSMAIQSGVMVGPGAVLVPGFSFIFTSTITLVAGSLFVMWLGEQITERGLGNGISMIIFAGIVSTLPSSFSSLFSQVRIGNMNPLVMISVIAISAGVVMFVVFVERAQRRITINYARRQQGNRLYSGQASHLPLKLNMSGVIPPIFASAALGFFAMLFNWLGWSFTASLFGPGSPVYILTFSALIIFFSFFYTALTFNSKETADNLKKSGGFIPGIRPGAQTASYVDKVLTRITLWGALYMTAVCLLPEIMRGIANIPFSLGGTSLLITVVVVMDLVAQIQAHLASHQYEGLMRKASLKGRAGEQ